ncbi:probable disease resistance protein RXW24L [Amborella trichopoda]|uniref:probable disease resistance protein RXW24L n=1 Tax=Amborella trichopoda TaxID=13333 RepID=UPI0009BFB5E8|nr:probable disease resistance protein RXW24L [Amborella trichopoda]|eukprot:XP_020524460.1 probable disease resistance protein RXW24L [Amborella trichopoda]
MNNLKLHRGRKCELNLVKKLTVYNKFATEVERIRRRVQKVKDRSSGYHLEVARDGGVPSNDSFIHWKDPRLAFSPMEKADIVGIDNPVSELSSWLFSMGSKSTVLSLVGMGGVGKTRVAKRVYNSNSNNFASCVRVTVSQSFKIVDILESNINEFGIARSLEGSSNESEKELQSKLLNYLNDHRT